jgi:hypothetical protein
MSQGMSVDDFLRHSNRSSGRKAYLRDWKKERPYEIAVWLHTLAPITALWRHSFPQMVVREDRETKATTKHVWGQSLVCYEDEDTLKSQYWRSKETGEREYPPKLCPICRLIEEVRRRVASGKLSWVEPVFQFRGASDPREDRVLHAGGLYNAFGAKDLSKADKEQMAAVKPEKGGPIYARDAWRQTATAKLMYLFVVVDNDDPAKGPQIAIESNLLGAKVQDVIAHACKSFGDPKLGNPILNPYAIQWTHNPADGIEFNKKYDACRLERLRISPAIEKMIRETEPPDTSQITDRFNPRTVRAKMEARALIDLPWGELFDDACKAWDAAPGIGRGKQEERVEGRVPDVGDAHAREFERRSELPETRVSPPVPAAADQLVACDRCEKPIRLSDPVCQHCGMKYDIVPAAAPLPPPLPKRSEARRAMMTAPLPPPLPGTPSVTGSDANEDYTGGGGGGFPGDPGDDIPF